MHVTPAVTELPATVRITVGSSTVATAGTVELDAPPGIAVSPPGPYTYDLTPGGHHHIDLEITGTTPGRHHLAARIRDPLGQLLEDVATLTVPPAKPAALHTGFEPAEPALLSAVLEPPAVTPAPGESAQLTLRLHNPSPAPIRGEAQLLSPFGTWGDRGDELIVEPWIQGYDLPANETCTLRFQVTALPGARPGSAWWALARITGFGEVTYTPAVALGIASP